jgi:hypothetical protein
MFPILIPTLVSVCGVIVKMIIEEKNNSERYNRESKMWESKFAQYEQIRDKELYDFINQLLSMSDQNRQIVLTQALSHFNNRQSQYQTDQVLQLLQRMEEQDLSALTDDEFYAFKKAQLAAVAQLRGMGPNLIERNYRSNETYQKIAKPEDSQAAKCKEISNQMDMIVKHLKFLSELDPNELRRRLNINS